MSYLTVLVQSEKRSSVGSPGQRPGQILFVIYINDIIDNLNSQVYLFANDMKLYTRINNDIDYNVLQSDINKVDEWTWLSWLWLL